MKRILIVEDHAIVRMGIDFLITDLFQPVDVHQASNFTSALALLHKNVFDLIVLDINIPGGENSRMINKIRAIQPSVKILVFSGSEEEIYALHYIHAGANGFLSKGASEDEYRIAIMAVLNNGKYISSKVQQQMVKNILDSKYVSSNPLEDLSKRELEVMHLLAQGKWTKEIATLLNLKETTISTYKARIFEKLEVANIIEMFKKLELYKTKDFDLN
ncbi:response regulator transcription factor [Dyadobacter sp. CY356]|uniref:response regulator n=1 Tax=Dyadobacter sp. CY356 TaxID=2906442 RepID=UPI001F1B3874|nr:response regulator transcription factor [Dyadobacter sp. CY356]MCF0054206.1 response regulator transcription factor [Dyadobacter sp. CY356]